MTTRLLPIISVLAASTSVSAQQIANGGFENWSDVFAYSNLQDWRTGNGQIPGLATTTQEPGPSGVYAALLQTHIVGTDTAFGFIIQGDIMDDVPTGGIPWTTAVDAVEGWYRCSLMPGDSAIVVVGVWSNGLLASYDIHRFGGTQPVWMAFDLPVNGGVPIVPDSVVVAAASSDPLNPAGIADGSWFEVDAIQLTSTIVPVPDLLPNYDMELWNDINIEDPDDWGTFNQALIQLGLTPVTKSLLAHSGSFSARIETIDLGTDTLPGVLSNGALSFEGPIAGVPYTDMPTSLDGWFMYEPSGIDTAIIYAQFTSSGVPVGTAAYGFFGSVPTWTAFSAPVTILFPPDSMLMVIFSGDNPGSVLYLDDLAFTGISTRIEEHAMDDMVLFPNPATDELHVVLPPAMSGEVRFRVFDATGRVVQERITAAGPGVNTWSISGLSHGQYWLETSGTGMVERLPFIKQ
ncbi:MAG TPA: T9SS type A sorting domain-containing protein [Flavobacteriales bacterium]|nr:T9SS type A sorting domain-containing protein [Flavobacteriales bacterium]